MTKVLDVYQRLRQSLTPNTLILTPNTRLADALLEYHAQFQAQVFIKPSIFPYTQWLIQSIKSHPQSEAMILTANQSNELGLSLLGEQTFASGLLKELKKAWALCHQWQVALDEHRFNLNQETQSFLRWTEQYQHRLTQLNAIDEAMLAGYLIHQLNSLSHTYDEVIWVHFNQFTPEQKSLFTWLEQQGIPCYTHQSSNKKTQSSTQFGANNPDHQQQTMLHWVKQQHRLGKQKIGIVVPNLNTQHRSLTRLFDQHFSKQDYNISLGMPLSDYPIVSQALEFLNLIQGELEHNTARLLLTTPYIEAAESERFKRWQCLNELTCLKQDRLKLKTLYRQLESKAPTLHRLLKAISQQDIKGNKTLNDWSMCFKQYLTLYGYPGEQGLDSHQYQCFCRFEALIDELIHFEWINPNPNFHQALHLLKRLAHQTLFQPQKSNARIQILGLLEASGLQFDALWVMDMTDQCLPNPVKLSAFIPFSLQKELNMPHSNHQNETRYAQQIIECFINNSESCVFSYAQFEDDITCLPSPMIKHLPSKKDLAPPQTEEAIITTTQIIEDNYFPIQAGESLKGGSFILKDQSLCPFKAFAKHRLNAKPSPGSGEGLDNLDRGILLHRVLENLWQRIQSHQNLTQHSAEDLNTIIKDAVTTALKPMTIDYPDVFTDKFFKLEQNRLTRLCRRWLDLEKKRPPFKVIAQEQSQTINLNGLTLNTRVDRVDRLDNGEKWVLDYKTGEPSVSNWFTEPTTSDPQLPLYALCDETINTLAFAQLKSRNLCFKGVSAHEQVVAGIKPLDKIKPGAANWQEQRLRWQEQLNQLADEITSGYIAIKPQKTSTCQQCDLKSVCRINDSTASA